VQRALDDSGGTDYWSIRNALPSITQRFVPRLLAAVAIVAAPTDYGINLYPIANSAYFAEVDLGGPADLRYFERSEQLSTPVFKRLNAAYKLPYTGPDGPFRILVPIDLEDHATELLQDLPANRAAPQTVHVIRSGDTLSGIAERYGVPLDAIRRDNKLSGNLLTVGRELVISGAATPATGPAHVSDPASALHHIVQAGDSFWKLGRRYATSGKTIAVLNNMSLNDKLQVGQQLTIRQPHAVIEYPVAAGDSLWTIARKFKVTIQELLDWNGLSQQQTLKPGQTLIVANPAADNGQRI
jgi:membrane-bound lytic murein transglycosylase D